MEDFLVFDGAVEIRRRGSGRSLCASFSYNSQATRSSMGRVRKERFESGSLSYQTREFARLHTELSSEPV